MSRNDDNKDSNHIPRSKNEPDTDSEEHNDLLDASSADISISTVNRRRRREENQKHSQDEIYKKQILDNH